MTARADSMTEMPRANGHGTSYVAPDVLSESLALLRVRGHVGSRTEAKGAWGLQLPASDSYFHVIERGSCWLELNDAKEPIRLEIGDAVILPHGHAHRLSDAPGRKTISLAQALERQRDGVVRLGSDGPATAIVCGAFRFDGGAGHPLLESLPPLLHVPSARTQALEYEEMVRRFLIHEVHHPHLGAEAVVARLVELLFVQKVRSWIDTQPAGAHGWLVALRHPVVKRVLERMHGDPARDWTLAELAASAGVSRSALSALFRDLLGVSPIAYLARWRLLLAARVLRDEGVSVQAAADRVGYEAQAAFSRAFKRQFGVAPATYRAQAAAPSS
jgi:AraC-like DNA-binding protein